MNSSLAVPIMESVSAVLAGNPAALSAAVAIPPRVTSPRFARN